MRRPARVGSGSARFRLRRYRARAAPFDAALPIIREISLRLNVWPDLYISDDVQGPVTFGAISPSIIFPRR
jgi:hypothetical protein